MSSAAVRAVPSTNPSARVASRFGGDDDEESDFDCRESSIASTTSATSVASGTRIFRADATTASAEAEGRIPPIPRASAVFGATAEANPRSPIDYESRIAKVSARLCRTSAWRKICWEGTTRWYFSCDYVGVRRGPGDRPIRIRDKRTRLFQLVPVGKLSALQTPAARGENSILIAHDLSQPWLRWVPSNVERARAMDSREGMRSHDRPKRRGRFRAFASRARVHVPDARRRETCRSGAVRLTGARETTDADVASTPRPPHPRRRLSLSTRPRWLRYAPSLRSPEPSRARVSSGARAPALAAIGVIRRDCRVSHPPAVCADKIRHPGMDARRRRRDRGARD